VTMGAGLRPTAKGVDEPPEGGFPIRVMRRLPQSGLRMQLAAPVA
jgi:hypothetical protein